MTCMDQALPSRPLPAAKITDAAAGSTSLAVLAVVGIPLLQASESLRLFIAMAFFSCIRLWGLT